MESLKTNAGQIHLGRVAFIGYLIFIVVCLAGRVNGGIGGAFITFAMGWLIAFCGKHPPDSWAEYNTDFRMRFGIVFFVACIAQGVSALWLLYYRPGH